MSENKILIAASGIEAGDIIVVNGAPVQVRHVEDNLDGTFDFYNRDLVVVWTGKTVMVYDEE